MNQCAFLSMDSLHEFECYDHLLIKPFYEAGWEVDVVSWRNEETDWNEYDAVIIRSCWDYQKEPGRFLEVLKKIGTSSARLVNSLLLVQWNIDKSYLKELSQKRISIVPTLWRSHFRREELPSFFTDFETDEIIIKPLIGANSDDTYWLNKNDSTLPYTSLEKTFNHSGFMVQPFIKSVIDKGEFSIFYFGDTCSHAILKTPKAGDFRVQEEHGGQLQLVEPGKKLLKAATKTMRALPEMPLYARLDFVKNSDTFLLMEVELIEPSLYFNMDPQSPYRFVRAFEKWWEPSDYFLQV